MALRIALSLWLTLLVCGPALAEDKPEAAAWAKTIARFVDEETVGVLRVDTSRVQVDPLIDKFIELVPEARDEEATARVAMKMALEAFRQAGGRDLFGVFSLADTELGGSEPIQPFLIAPLKEGATEQALMALFPQGGKHVAFERLGDVIFVGSRKTFERVKALKPAERPELAKAFAAAGDATAQALLLPTADNRRVIEELLPELPREAGGGSSRIVTRGLLWAAVGVDAPPAMSLRVVVQSESAEAASALRDKLVEAYGWAGRQDEVRKRLPTFDRLAKLFTPEVQDGRLVLVLNEENRGVAELVDLITPVVRQAREDARRAMSVYNLRQIAVAMHNYHSENKHFPAAASHDADGKPLLSWRVHILPFVEEQELYDRFHLDEPWDSEHNRKLIERTPAIYRSSASKRKEKGHASYVVVVGEETVFPAGKGLAIKEIRDGTAHTIMVVEIGDQRAPVWTKPDDLSFDPDRPTKGFGGLNPQGFNAAFCDGSVHFLSQKIDPKVLRALVTPAGGEVIPAGAF